MDCKICKYGIIQKIRIKSKGDSRMNWENELQKIKNGRVLDVATGAGGFLTKVEKYLSNPEKMIGIDTNQNALDIANKNLSEKGYEFFCMNGTQLDFNAGSFDVVTMSNSVHHFSNPEEILGEMIRVLKPDGLLLIYEMVRDGVTSKQKSHVLLHDFWGKIDTQLGVCHNPTFKNDELKNLLTSTNELNLLFTEVEVIDENNQEEENEEEMLEEIRGVLDRYVNLAITNNLSNLEEISKEAEYIMDYVQTEGFDSAPEYYYLLKKKNEK